MYSRASRARLVKQKCIANVGLKPAQLAIRNHKAPVGSNWPRGTDISGPCASCKLYTTGCTRYNNRLEDQYTLARLRSNRRSITRRAGIEERVLDLELTGHLLHLFQFFCIRYDYL